MKILFALIRLLPHKAALALGRLIGRILRLVLWKKTDRCESRCVKSLGLGITLSREIIKYSFMNLGMSVVEFIRFPKMKKDVKKFMDFDEHSIKNLRDALSRGKGVILMTNHSANWELAAMRAISEGFELHAVYTPQKNEGGINDEITRIRTQVTGMKVIESEGAGLREIFKTLRNNGIVVIMQDLDARKDGVITNFLGLPASTHDGIIKLYNKFKSPIVPAKCVRDFKNPEHHRVFIPEILSDRKNFGEDLKASLEICNEFIEDCIKENPGLWLWLMDRWEYTLGKKI